MARLLARGHHRGMRTLRSWHLLLIALVVGMALVLPAPAAARDDGARQDDRREVRKDGSCSGSSEWSLRLRADDGAIRVEFEIEMRRSRATWRVILLHERRTAFSGTVQARGSANRVRLRRVLPDWYGLDTITVRASGPRSESCRVSATV